MQCFFKYAAIFAAQEFLLLILNFFAIFYKRVSTLYSNVILAISRLFSIFLRVRETKNVKRAVLQFSSLVSAANTYYDKDAA